MFDTTFGKADFGVGPNFFCVFIAGADLDGFDTGRAGLVGVATGSVDLDGDVTSSADFDGGEALASESEELEFSLKILLPVSKQKMLIYQLSLIQNSTFLF